MILEKLIAPRWKHKNPQVRKRALLSLDPNKDESQRIFLEVLGNDPELFIRRIAIKGLTNISQLQNLRESADQSEIYQEATARLCELLATVNNHRPLSYLKNALSAISENRILEYVALHANDEELQLSVLDKVANESILFEILNTNRFEKNKKHALARMQSANSLKRAIKILRRKDKELALEAQSMLDRIQEKQKYSTELQKEYKRATNEFLELFNLCKFSGEWKKYEHRLRELNDRCHGLMVKDSDLGAKSNFETLAEIENAFLYFEEQLKDVTLQASQRPDWESSENSQEETVLRPAELDNLEKTLQGLVELNSKLAHFQSPDWSGEKQNCEQDFTRLKNNWTATLSTIEMDGLPADIEAEIKDFKFRFSGEETRFKQNLLKMEEAGSFLSFITSMNEQAKRLLDNKDLVELEPVNKLLKSYKGWEKRENLLGSASVIAETRELYQALEQKQKEIELYMEELCKEFSTLTARLEQALAKGKAKNVKQMLNRGRNILRQLPGNFLSRLEKNGLPATFNQLVRRADALLEWRQWSTSTLKEQLVEKMEALASETHAHASDEDYDFSHAASEISRARAQWKQASKGIVDKEVSLWEKFDEACNRAYQPCQDYFNKLDEQRKKNLEQREAVCADLEKYFDSVAKLPPQEVNWKALEKIIRTAREDWEKLGVVGRSSRQAINRRFHDVLHKLENLVRNRRNDNREFKQALIKRVEVALKQLQDKSISLESAVDLAKKSQAEWKNIGPASKDKQLWKNFRSVCDAVFAVKQEEHGKIMQEEARISAQRENILSVINSCLTQQASEVFQARDQVEKLQAEWQSLPKLKRNDKLERRFSDACENFSKKLHQAKRDQIKTLKQQIQKNVAGCYQLETMIYECLQGQLEINTLAEAIAKSRENWNSVKDKSLAFTAAIDSRLAQLEKHVVELLNGQGSEVERSLSEQHENRIRNKENLCIQLEILANKDSPEDSKQKRMEIQVARLADTMKRVGKPDLNKEVQALLSQWHTSGFILPPESEQFEKRFYSALELLDKDYQYPL